MPCWTRRNLKSGNLPPLNPRELHSDYNTKRDVFVLTEEQRHELQRINREYLTTSPLPTREGKEAEGAPALPTPAEGAM